MRLSLRELNLFFLAFFGFSLLAYLLLNGGAYWRVARYAIFLNSPLASADLREGELLEFPSQNSGGANVSANGTFLVIPKIEVDAPVIAPRNSSKDGILASLEEGAGIYPGSVSPGETGRLIILGHSSKASWYRGNYAYVFALLNKLEAGDEFYIVTGGQKYTYRVFANKVLTPKETNEFLSTKISDSEIDLVTCYPVGSASKRTIIQAKLIDEEAI